MKKRSSRNEPDDSSREYIAEVSKAAMHPVRSRILEVLQEESPLTTTQLEELLKERRYNLYHHLKLLEDLHLIRSERIDGKTRQYHLNAPAHPVAAVVIMSEKKIVDYEKEFTRLIKVLEKIEGQEIPHTEKINRVEVTLHYG